MYYIITSNTNEFILDMCERIVSDLLRQKKRKENKSRLLRASSTQQHPIKEPRIHNMHTEHYIACTQKHCIAFSLMSQSKIFKHIAST